MLAMLMLTSNEYSVMFNTASNDDLGLCHFLRSFCGFLSHKAQNKYFELKYSLGSYRPNSNYLLSSVTNYVGHNNISKQCNHIQKV